MIPHVAQKPMKGTVRINTYLQKAIKIAKCHYVLFVQLPYHCSFSIEEGVVISRYFTVKLSGFSSDHFILVSFLFYLQVSFSIRLTSGLIILLSFNSIVRPRVVLIEQKIPGCHFKSSSENRSGRNHIMNFNPVPQLESIGITKEPLQRLKKLIDLR